MSLRQILGLTHADAALAHTDPALAHPVVAAIHERLAGLSLERAKFVAAFAGLLTRVAFADLEISHAERATLHALLADKAGLTPDEASAVGAIVTHQATALAGIDYAALTRVFNDIADAQAKEQLIDCLYAIATAQSTVSIAEDDQIRAVANALLLSHEQFIAIRHRYKE